MKKLLLLSITLTLSPTVLAETFNVSTTEELRSALAASANNNESDSILIGSGVLKTTDDGLGTFEYISNQADDLEIIGNGMENTIISGDFTDQILKIFPVENINLTIKHISFINGSNQEQYGNGGAIHIQGEYKLDSFTIESTKFEGNQTTSRGGAIYYWGENLSISSSEFINNNSDSSGGAIYTASSLISTSKFINNTAQTGGGVYLGSNYAFSNINNSEFDGNHASKLGGAILWRSSKTGILKKNIFTSNTSDEKGGAVATENTLDLKIEQNHFKENIASQDGGALYLPSSPYLYISNNIFHNNADSNNSGLYFNQSGYGGDREFHLTNNLIKNSSVKFGYMSNNNNIINNIFTTNHVDVTVPNENFVLNLKHNYIDTLALPTMVLFEEGNLYLNADIGFVSEETDDFHLSPDSDLIDAGTIDGITQLEEDFDGILRVSGTTIDIGPYEFSSTLPTIHDITIFGELKEQSLLSLTVDYTLAEDREHQTTEYDFTNDGNFVEDHTYAFNQAGTYTITVKVTDSEGEFSRFSKDITIAELPYDEMTFEQKLIKAINPDYYDTLVNEINQREANSYDDGIQNVLDNLEQYELVTKVESELAVSSAKDAGIAEGKQLVQNSPTEFGLVTIVDKDLAIASAKDSGVTEGKQYVLDNLNEFELLTKAASDELVETANQESLVQGQQEVIANPAQFGIATKQAITANSVNELNEGWHMIASETEIVDLTVFSNAIIVWQFNAELGGWAAYSANESMMTELINKGIPALKSISAGSGLFIAK